MRLNVLRQRSSGFSLLELMVTVGLLSLLLFFVAPDMGTWSRNMQVRGEAEALQNGLQRARNEAVRRNRTVQFSLINLNDSSKMDDTCVLSTAGTSWVISLEDPTKKCAQLPSETTAPKIIAAHAAGSAATKVKVTATGDESADANAIVFDSYGRMKGNTEPIRRIVVESLGESDGARTLHILLNAAGSIRMCDPKVSATGDPRKC